MLSKEKLLEAMDTHIAELMAEQVYVRIRKDSQEQWNKVIYELVSTRKNNERLKEDLNRITEYATKLELLVNRLEAKAKVDEDKQRKQNLLLDTVIKELGLEEE